MPDFLRDGSGKGYLAKVNSDGQLLTRATGVEQHTHSTLDGNYFEASSGLVTLTNAVETGILYLYNGETYTLVVDKVFIDFWASTNGVGGGKVKYYKNPTITGGSAIVPTNTNFAKGDTLLGTYLKSLTTITGGTNWYTGYFDAGSTLVYDEEKFCIPPGYAFGISITAPASNTSMALSINIAFYKFDTELLG